TALLPGRWRGGGQAARERALPNTAVPRWRITALPSQPLPIPSAAREGGNGWGAGVGRPRWRVELLRCRGGEPACWEMEVPDATDPISLAAALADRPASSVTAQKYRRAI